MSRNKKIYTDVHPRRELASLTMLTEKLQDGLLTKTEVVYDNTFDRSNVLDLALLIAVDAIKEEANKYNLEMRIGIHRNPSRNYLGWKLVIEIEANKQGVLINQLLYRFVEWDKMESQDVLTFEDLMR